MDLRLTRCDLVGRDLVIISGRDVTQQKRLEDRLRQSERNLAEGQRLTKAGSWILDFKTGNTDWSIETCRIFGFPDPPPSPHYSEFRARVRHEDRDGVDRGLRESFETGEPRPLEYFFILPNGVNKYIETISQPVKDETGAVVKLMGTVMVWFECLTGRKKAEEALRGSEHLARGQLEALTHTLDALALESDPDKLLEHVLRTIVEQSGAHSVSVWDRNNDDSWLELVAVIEDGRFQTRSDAVHPAAGLTILAQNHPVWSEILRTGHHGVLEDIDQASARMSVGAEPDAIWHRVLEDTDPGERRGHGDIDRAVPNRQLTTFRVMSAASKTRSKNALADKIQVLIADDHVTVREGLAAMIGRQPDMIVVGEAANGREAVDLWRKHSPDVALLDLRMPIMDGVGAIDEIRRQNAGARVIVLTTFDTDNEISHALKAGAKEPRADRFRRQEKIKI